MRNVFNTHRIFSVHQHGPCFIVLYTYMAAMTSCESDLFLHRSLYVRKIAVEIPGYSPGVQALYLLISNNIRTSFSKREGINFSG